MPHPRDRTAILDAAESLFARRGIHGVSLREVTLAAGVRNKSAVQYHFGDRAGLVHAVLARRGETLGARRAAALDELVMLGSRFELRSLCRAIVEPYCAFLGDDAGAHAYLVIAREVLGDPGYSYDQLQERFNDPLLPELIGRLLDAIELPAPIAAERALVAVSAVIGSVADRARRQMDETSPREMSPLPLFVANLVDMLGAAVSAGAHPSTLAAAVPTTVGSPA